MHVGWNLFLESLNHPLNNIKSNNERSIPDVVDKRAWSKVWGTSMQVPGDLRKTAAPMHCSIQRFLCAAQEAVCSRPGHLFPRLEPTNRDPPLALWIGGGDVLPLSTQVWRLPDIYNLVSSMIGYWGKIDVSPIPYQHLSCSNPNHPV
jgi:hypothetical protein